MCTILDLAHWLFFIRQQQQQQKQLQQQLMFAVYLIFILYISEHGKRVQNRHSLSVGGPHHSHRPNQHHYNWHLKFLRLKFLPCLFANQIFVNKIGWNFNTWCIFSIGFHFSLYASFRYIDGALSAHWPDHACYLVHSTIIII